MTTLAAVPPGCTGKILGVSLPESLRLRLMELGLVPGTNVEVVRYAPLGDPIEVKLRGYRLSLRGAEAAGVLVEAAGSC